MQKRRSDANRDNCPVCGITFFVPPSKAQIYCSRACHGVAKAAHGHASRKLARRSRTYSSWHCMKDRCQRPNNRNYADYGGRGITVCERWQDFKNFLADMGECPPDLTLERIDVNGSYEPSNCRWASWDEQRRNKRCETVSYGGSEFKVQDLADSLGIGVTTLRSRLRANWSQERWSERPKSDRYNRDP